MLIKLLEGLEEEPGVTGTFGTLYKRNQEDSAIDASAAATATVL